MCAGCSLLNRRIPSFPAAEDVLDNRFRLFFFLNFLGNGVLMPFMALYLAGRGLNGVEVGVVLGTLPLVRMIAQPLWGMLGDAFRIHRLILSASLLALAGTGLLLTRVHGFWAAFLAILLFAAMDAPYIPFGTTLALNHLERSGQTERFGPLRLWGSLGYIAGAVVIGALLLESALWSLPVAYALLMALAGLAALRLPDGSAGIQAFHWRDSLTLLTQQPVFGVFLVGVALCGATVGIGSQFLPIYLDQLHAAGWMIGLSMGLQAAMEIPLMGRMPAILRRFGVPAALLVGVSVLPLRWFLHIVLRSPLWLLPVQLLHGFTIAGVMVVGALWVNRRLPLHLRATGQALYTAVFGGLGWAGGLLAAGVVNDYLGMSAVWWMALGLSLVGVALVRWVLKREPTPAA